jgi:predicted RNase H-like HicB family nuclease
MGGRKGKRKVKPYHLTAVIWKEGRQYVSKCPELGVASFGSTPERARAALEEAAELFISNAKRLHLLKDVEPALSSATRFTVPLEIAPA